ncbi:unnamed protein product [Paramecium pentaurelia]|uniref:non-specific serine/threonine protein kinase n=1 Tax=Paramecium pentaurelia TaxID=43138 RepID=A0A8S1WLP1_9CILI|nr:unnamed protein product [Paramecium pentaurelia]
MNQQNLPFECFGQKGVKYICQQLIGSGTQGRVYSGIREDQPQTKLAIKFTDDIKDDELQFLDYIQKSTKQLKHIIKYYEVVDYTKNNGFPKSSQIGKYLFVMELGSKNLLEEVIQSNRYIDKQKLNIICQIALGIFELHQIKHSHRDIKPENIILVGDIWKLCDFGFVKHSISQKQTQKVGTPYYIAPEVFLENSDSIRYDNKVDVWSFGCIIYEIFTKNLFFNGSSPNDVSLEIENYCFQQQLNPREKNTDPRFQNLHNQELQILCKCMMTVNPQERYDSKEVVEKLKNICNVQNNPADMPPIAILEQKPNGQNNPFGGINQKQPNQQTQISFEIQTQAQSTIESKFQFQSAAQTQLTTNQYIQPSALQIKPSQQQQNNMQNKQNPQTFQKVNTVQNQQTITQQIPTQQIPIQNQLNLQSQVPIQNQQTLLQQNHITINQNQPQANSIFQNPKQSLTLQKNQSQMQFQISIPSSIVQNNHKQNQLIDDSNILNLQKVDSSQIFQQNSIYQINKDDNDLISKYLDKIVKPEYKSQLKQFIQTSSSKIKTNNIDVTQDIVKENLIQILIEFIQSKVQNI